MLLHFSEKQTKVWRGKSLIFYLHPGGAAYPLNIETSCEFGLSQQNYREAMNQQILFNQNHSWIFLELISLAKVGKEMAKKEMGT